MRAFMIALGRAASPLLLTTAVLALVRVSAPARARELAQEWAQGSVQAQAQGLAPEQAPAWAQPSAPVHALVS